LLPRAAVGPVQPGELRPRRRGRRQPGRLRLEGPAAAPVTWRPSRSRAACGLIGPLAFTTAWALSRRRHEMSSVPGPHITGPAAPDARHPHLMTAGFLALGACTIAFARELHGWLGGRRAGPGPAMLGLAGAATVSAGLLRRDRMSNTPPPGMEGVPQSRTN